MKTSIFRLGAALALSCAVAGMAQAETIKLRISTGFPAVHDIVTQLVTPWVDDVAKESGVQIETQLFAAGSAFGALDRQLTQVQKGLVDAAIGLAAVPRGRMPHLLLGDAPFLTPDGMVLQQAFDDIWPDVTKDFPGVHLVGIGIDCSKLHTADKPVRSLDDLKGMRIRVPSVLLADMVAAAGGVPVTMPQSDVYESLERHVIDGAITPWDVIQTLKLGEVLKYHDTQNLACGELWFGFNQKKFDSLPEPVKAAIDNLDRLAFAERAQALYARSNASAIAFVKARGNEIVTLPPANMALWKERSQPAMDKYLSETEAAGVTDIREVFARLQDAIAAHQPK